MIATIIEILLGQGWQLLAGASVILGLGGLAMALSRAPIHRQRIAELSIAGFAMWLLLVLVPMPRLFSWGAPSGLSIGSELSIRPAAAAPIELEPSLASTLAAQRQPLPQSVGPWLLTLFLGGSALMLASLGIGLLSLGIQLRRSQRAPSWLRRLGQRLQRETSREMRLRILISARPTRPFCFGLVAGTIVLPAELCAREKHAQLCGVLRHEIAHLQQRDTQGQLLFALALPLLFFHPLYWWLRHQSRLSAELIADDQAARHGGRISYARELIALSQQNLPGSVGLLPAMPAIASKTQFYRRMTMLLQREDDLATRCSPLRQRLQLSLAGLLLATGASLWGVEPLAAQQPASRPSRESHRELINRQVRVETLQIKIIDLQRQLAQVLQKNQAAADSTSLQTTIRQVQRIVETIEAGGGGHLGKLIRGKPEVETEEEETIEDIAKRESALVELRLDELRKRGAPAIDPDNGLLRIFGIPTVISDQRSAPMALPRAEAQIHDSAATLDLLLRHIDLEAQRRDAELRLSELAMLNTKGMVSSSALQSAHIELQSTIQKMKLLRRIMEMEAKACRIELESLQRRHSSAIQDGRSPDRIEAAMLRLQTRLELLKSVH